MRRGGALVSPENVLAGTSSAGAVSVQLTRVSGQALVDVQAHLFVSFGILPADEAAAALTGVARKGISTHCLPIFPAQ